MAVLFNNLRTFFRSRIKRQPPSGKPDGPTLPLGLSQDQLAQIQGLTETNQYKHYLVALERLYENNLTAMLRGLSHEAYLFQCGVCFALEQIASLPGDLTLKQKDLHGRHTSTDTEPDASALFANTPFWDAYQRLGKRARQYGSPSVSVPGQ